MHTITKIGPERAEEFRQFVQGQQQDAYTRPDLGITADCFSEEIFGTSEAVAIYESYCAADENTQAWMAVNGNREIVGTVAAKRQPDYCEQNSLYVARELRGLGVGRALFEHVLTFAGPLPIRVDVVNYMASTIAVYEHWGFVANPEAGKPGCIWWKHWPKEAIKNFQLTYMFRESSN